MTGSADNRETSILELARSLHARSQPAPPSRFDRILESAMEDEELRADLFRLLDVLPMLSNDEEVSRHVREYLLHRPRRLPPLLAAGLQAAGARAFAGVASRTIRTLASQMAERFIVGATPAEALGRLEGLHRSGFAFSADLLGEATVSASEGDAYVRRYFELLDVLCRQSGGWGAQPLVDDGPNGPVPRANLSLKLSSLLPRLDPLDHDHCVSHLAELLHPLFLRAIRQGAALTIDMEQWDLHGIAWDVFEELVCRPDLDAWPHFGIVVQAYLKAASRDVERLLALARRRGAPLCVRLVKGAYWDYEVAHAGLHGLPCPVLVGKERTDASFEAMSERLLANTARVLPGIGSHNLRSLSHAIVAARGLSAPPGFEMQCLTAWRTPGAMRFGTSACGSGSTRRSGSFCPVSPTSCAGCWRTARTPVSCARQSMREGPSSSLRPDPCTMRSRTRRTHRSNRPLACSVTAPTRISPIPKSEGDSPRRSLRSAPFCRSVSRS